MARRSQSDPAITKRRVTMRKAFLDAAGNPVVQEVNDFVRPDFLDAYVADAKTRWDSVAVSAEPDAGPGGFDGATYVPKNLDHPLAHNYFPASDCTGCSHAPVIDGVPARTVTSED